MTRWQAMVLDFHVKYGHEVGNNPTAAGRPGVFRASLIREEVERELMPALIAGDLEAIADGIGDSIYVLLGTAVTYGIDMQPIFEAIHAANMAKNPPAGPESKPTKPPGWAPPDVAGLLREQGWEP